MSISVPTSGMAGFAGRVVVRVQQEEFLVLEARRLPPLVRMALLAIAGDLSMQAIGR